MKQIFLNERKLNTILYSIGLVIFLCLSLGPLLWCLILSLSPEQEILRSTSQILPTHLSFENFAQILNPDTRVHKTIMQALENSLYCALFATILGVLSSLSCAYGFFRFRICFKTYLLQAIILTIVIPVFATVIPIYSLYSQLGILNNLSWVSLVFVSSYLPLNTWIMINYFKSIPKSIWEAASLDGCTEIQSFFKIILPLSYPIIACSALLFFIMAWSQFQVPLILTSSQANKVITLVLSEFMSRDTVSYGAIAACGLFSILPPACLSLIFRKFLVQGLTSGAVKA